MTQRLWTIVDRAIIAVAGVILLAAILHVTADVALKYFFARPIPGTIVYVSNFYMTMVVFLPLAAAERRGQHIVVDLWPRSAPRWLDSLSQRFTWAFSALVYGFLTWNTLLDAMRKQSEGEYVLDQSGLVTTWPSYYILPLGMALMVLLLVAKIFQPGLAEAPSEVLPGE